MNGALVKWAIAALFAVVIIVSAVVYMNQTQMPDVYLVAHDAVPVYQSEGDAMSLPSSQVSLRLAPSQRVPVIERIDAKHYLIYEIRMPNGQRGFVNDGKYSLEKRR